jgi:hypothetical protein
MGVIIEIHVKILVLGGRSRIYRHPWILTDTKGRLKCVLKFEERVLKLQSLGVGLEICVKILEPTHADMKPVTHRAFPAVDAVF